MLRRSRIWIIGLLVVLAALALRCAAAESTQERNASSSLPPKSIGQAVVSIRTLGLNGTEPVTTGSGFFVSDDGRLVTNHHVVGLAMRKPGHYRLQVKLQSGEMVTAKILGFSLADDLAVLQILSPRPSGSSWIRLPMRPSSPKSGSSVFAFGDASGLGVVSTRGHFSGRLHKAGFERYHFTGTINAGMSGGPAVDQYGTLIGVNAARKTDAEQMGFLVPADQVVALVESTAGTEPLRPTSVQAEIKRQMALFHAQLERLASESDQSTTRYGDYRVPEFGAAGLHCGPIDNTADDDEEVRPADVQGTACRMMHSLELGDDIVVGHFAYSHRHFRAKGLNAVRFNALMDAKQGARLSSATSKVMAAASCVDKFTYAGREGKLPVRLTWCAQAYREFDDLYDVTVSVVTRDRPTEAVAYKLEIAGVTWQLALIYARRLMEGMQ